jgi:uncharacterized membrane protein
MFKKIVFLFFILVLTGMVFGEVSKSSVTVEVIDYKTFVDVVLEVDGDLNIFLPDFEELIFLKTTLDDTNYILENKILNIISETSYLVVLKYSTDEFSVNNLYVEKTLDFSKYQNLKLKLRIESLDNLLEVLPEDNYESGEFYVWDKFDNLLYIRMKNQEQEFQAYAALIASFIVLIILGYMYFKRKNAPEKDSTVNSDFLTEKEAHIIGQLLKKDGIIQQKIADELGLTKSNLTKILNKLERKELIVRKRVGKVNKVFLSEKVKKMK